MLPFLSPARTQELMSNFEHLYEQQYAVALFNSIRFDIEGGGGPQPQLLHRKVKYCNDALMSQEKKTQAKLGFSHQG